MLGEITILIGQQPQRTDEHLAKLTEFYGGYPRFARAGIDELTGGCVAVSAEVLAESPLMESLKAQAGTVFVFGFNQNHSDLLSQITGGGLKGVEGVRTGCFRVPESARRWCRQLSGLSFGKAAQQVFVPAGDSERITTLIAIEDKPYFVRLPFGEGELFLCADRDIADLDQRISGDGSPLEVFGELAPASVFLSEALGEAMWRNLSPKASFIVDDPLLKPRYGFLSYERLLETIAETHGSASLAFIPWNYRRTNKETARSVSAHPSRFSICVHGCDHTWGEFRSKDVGWLQAQARAALQRMARHRELSGLSFDKVMVFPQGIFSREAMRALHACGYLAAVNSTPFAVNEENGSLPLRELLGAAVTSYSSCPLFVRHYPSDFERLAFDLFLGKPALLVEHHTFFQRGYDALKTIVQRLNRLDDRLEWTTVGRVCAESCWTRRHDGQVQTRFWTNPSLVSNASFGCESADESRNLGGIRVKTRRYLSEFRDNYIETNGVLRAAWTAARNAWAKS